MVKASESGLSCLETGSETGMKAVPSENIQAVMNGGRLTKFEFFLEKYFAWKENEKSEAANGGDDSKVTDECLDFTFGNPQYEASQDYVRTLQENADPKGSVGYFGYRFNKDGIRKALHPQLLRRYQLNSADLDYQNIIMTTGAIAGLTLCLHAVVNPGDEVIYCSPGWILYEAIIHGCRGNPVNITLDMSSNSEQATRADMDRIMSGISSRTKAIIINSPHNPTGRIYSEDDLVYLSKQLQAFCAWRNSPIYLISDEPYSDIILDEKQRHFTPLRCYDYSMVVYSYGKTLLAPSQRIGYVLLPSRMPGVTDMVKAIETSQFILGYCVPNALMLESCQTFENFRDSFDLSDYRKSRDTLLSVLQGAGYRVSLIPQGTFYVLVDSPLKNDNDMCNMLQRKGLMVMPGSVLGAPGTFRITFIARSDRIRRAGTALARAMDEVQMLPLSDRFY